MFLKEDYVLDEDQDGVSTPVCNTLFRCMLNTFHHGLREGGGIGDTLKSVDWGGPTYALRVAFDMTFWIIVILIVLNLLLGVIIDTFADQRKTNEEEELRNQNNCFICGISRAEFDGNSTSSFSHHTEKIHNKWSYLNFLVLLRTKDHTELTGPESAVYGMIANVPEPDLSWFPRLRKGGRATADDDEDGDGHGGEGGGGSGGGGGGGGGSGKGHRSGNDAGGGGGGGGGGDGGDDGGGAGGEKKKK